MSSLFSLLKRLQRGCRLRVALVALVAAFGVAGVATASDVPLSLEEAVESAPHGAPSIAARQAAVDSAQATVEPAGALPDPQLVAGVENLPIDTGDAFSLTRDFMTMRKVGVMQELPQRPKRQARRQLAQAQVGEAQAALVAEQLSLRESTARAWLGRAVSEQRVALLRSLQPRAEGQEAAATAALASGRGSVADALAAKASRAALADRIDQAERELEEARTELLRWLPDSGSRPLAQMPNFTDLGFDASEVLTRVAHHRDLLRFEASEQVAQSEIAMAEAEKRPDWSVELDYAQRGPGFSRMVSLQFRVGLPLFAAHRQDPLIASRRAALKQWEAERDDALRQRTADLRKALATWRSAGERLQRYRDQLLPLADDRAEAALASYRGGRSDLQTTLAAFDASVEQRLVYSELTSALGQSWATLRYAFAEDR